MVGLLFTVCTAILGPYCQDVPEPVRRVWQGLPVGPPPSSPRADWLIDAEPFAARVLRSAESPEVRLTNGLIERRFRLAPNAATVAVDHHVTGQSMLRAVRPEARLVLDGVEYDVGGLVGQPNHAFLREEWLDDLRSDPAAFQLVGFEVGEPQERFAWARVRHDEGRPWPPPGVALRFDYEAGPQAQRRHTANSPAPPDDSLPVLLDDRFDALDSAWSVHRTDHERASFQNEGKVGEIFAPANTCVFAERALPGGVFVLECTLNPGTDPSKSWGPGVAVQCGDRWIKLALRPGDRRFGVYDGSSERLLGSLKSDGAHRLRMEFRAAGLVLFAGAADGDLEELARLEELAGRRPSHVRVGKLSMDGGRADFADPGEWGRCRIQRLRVLGDPAPSSRAASRRRAEALAALRVSVHYELYDGIPLLSKWIEVHNPGDGEVALQSYTSEILAAVERDSRVEFRGQVQPPPNIHAETDYAFGGMAHENANRHTVHWVTDPAYATQVNYLRRTPCQLELRPDVGPDQLLGPGDRFESFRGFLLFHDSEERERRGLGLRRMYRTIAPWVTENPLMMHVRRADPESVELAIEQCAEVGFEMLILTFGSGFNIEDESPENLRRWKELADLAHSKGLDLGGYSLLSSRRVQPDSDNIVNPETGRPGGQTHGFCPALASDWGQRYFRRLYQFFEATGFDLLEHDGSYPGDVDAAARPPLQRGADDSQWVQWNIISDFYQWCRGRGVYLNVPDYYYLAGANKCGMGYRETNWSLPREQQLIHARQNIYDGTWNKTPSMGWMFVPLTQYHGGGPAATVEPLDEHLDTYEMHMANCLGAGVQACYRGPRLYDTERTKAAVKRWVSWYKEHRAILESDVIHGRRADGRDVDWILHVNPRLETRGMLCVYNPMGEEVTRTLRVPLYYAGLSDRVTVVFEDGVEAERALDRRWEVELEVRVAANRMTWVLFR